MTPLFNSDWFFITALVIVAAIVCARLRIWQLDRLSQRRAFSAQVVAMLSAQILPALLHLNPISGSTSPPMPTEVEPDLSEGVTWVTPLSGFASG